MSSYSQNSVPNGNGNGKPANLSALDEALHKAKLLQSLGVKPARSEAQQAASRANGQKSRGPKTPEGKARSAQNALKHGLSGRPDRLNGVLLEDEDPQEFKLFFEDLFHSYAPQTGWEAQLVKRIAVTSWRLERLWREYASFFNRSRIECLYSAKQPRPLYDVITMKNLSMEGLIRYETALERSLQRTETQLRHIQLHRLRYGKAPQPADSPEMPEPEELADLTPDWKAAWQEFATSLGLDRELVEHEAFGEYYLKNTFLPQKLDPGPCAWLRKKLLPRVPQAAIEKAQQAGQQVEIRVGFKPRTLKHRPKVKLRVLPNEPKPPAPVPTQTEPAPLGSKNPPTPIPNPPQNLATIYPEWEPSPPPPGHST
jgi:hypothetical protein